MNTYQGDALDNKIANFLEKKMAKFPELQYSRKREEKYIYAKDFKNFLHDYSIVLKRFMQA